MDGGLLEGSCPGGACGWGHTQGVRYPGTPQALWKGCGWWWWCLHSALCPGGCWGGGVVPKVPSPVGAPLAPQGWSVDEGILHVPHALGLACAWGCSTPGGTPCRGGGWGESWMGGPQDTPRPEVPHARRGSCMPRGATGRPVPGGSGGTGARGGVQSAAGARPPPRPAAACASLAGPLFAQGSQLPLAHAAAYKAEPEPAAGQRRRQRQRPAAPGPPSPPPAACLPRPAGTMRAAPPLPPLPLLLLLLLLALLLPGRAARPKLALPIRPDTDPLPPGGAAGRSPPFPSPAPPAPAPGAPRPTQAAAAPPLRASRFVHPPPCRPHPVRAPHAHTHTPTTLSLLPSSRSGSPPGWPGPAPGAAPGAGPAAVPSGRRGGAGRCPGLRQGGARGPEVTGGGGGGGWVWGGLRRLRLRGALLCPGGELAPGPGGALRGDALRYLPLRAGECPPAPAPPFPRETPQDPALLGRGLAGGGGRPLPSIHPLCGRVERGPLQPADTWMSPPPPPRQWGGEGGFKGSGFIPPPPPRGWPPAPSLPPSSPPRPGLAGPCTAGQGLGAMGRGPGLGCRTGSWGLRKVSGLPAGAPDGPRGGEPGCAGGAELGTAWHGSAHLGTALLGSSPPPAEEPPGEASRESELQEHEAGLPRAHLPPGHAAARALLPHLPQR